LAVLPPLFLTYIEACLQERRDISSLVKLRVALGGEAGTANWIAPKPKGMWHRTYERKKLEIWWCEN
jgi:hypothetical protein